MRLSTELGTGWISILFIVWIQLCDAIPQRGNYPWTLILCKFRDIPDEPRSPEWFRDWMTDEVNEGSILRFFREVSNGMYSIYDSNVVGWYTLPYTKAQVYRIAERDPYLRKVKDEKLKVFYTTKELCVDYARRRGDTIHSHIISVINDENTAVFCKENGVLLTPKFLLSSALAHEITHDFNIGHSYSDKRVKIFPYSSYGEYDDKYDLMSTANAYMYKAPYGMNGPGLIGPHLDYLGWIPANRVYYFGKSDRKDAVIRLASLSVAHHQSTGYLLVIVPYDRDNPLNVYTVEYRTPTANDKGIKKGAVVIHRIENRDGYFYSFLITQGSKHYELIEGTEWLHFTHASSTHGRLYIRIRFITSNVDENAADVHIITNFDPSACIFPEIPRQTNRDDGVCVTKAEQELIRNRTDLSPTREFSPGACKPGFVHRMAMLEDKVCVTRGEKRETDDQNRKWHRRKRFFQRDTYGLNACKNGMVWRQIDPYDYTCVTPNTRRSVLRQNTLDSTRRDAAKGTCRNGFTERRAFYGDHACVTHRTSGRKRQRGGIARQ